MSSYFNLTLDTTAPSNITLSIMNGAQFATQQLVDLTIGCTDPDTIGYQILIWSSDIDPTYDTDIQASEVTSTWITYTTSKQIKLSENQGEKVIFLRVRDSVNNPSSQISDSIILDTSLPVVTISGADVTKISKITGKDTASFSFQCNEIFSEYKIKVVNSTGASHDTGIQIPTTAGSTNMSGIVGNYPANTPINASVKGSDLQTASSGDGVKIIKVFVLDQSGFWSA